MTSLIFGYKVLNNELLQSTPVGSLQTTAHDVVISPNRERHPAPKVTGKYSIWILLF